MSDNIINLPLKNDLDKIKIHLRIYKREYVVGATTLTLGYILGKNRIKAPKVDTAKVVLDWMTEQSKQGFNVYALTNHQKDLWESCWSYVTILAKEEKQTIPETVAQAVKEYQSFIDTSPVR